MAPLSDAGAAATTPADAGTASLPNIYYSQAPDRADAEGTNARVGAGGCAISETQVTRDNLASTLLGLCTLGLILRRRKRTSSQRG